MTIPATWHGYDGVKYHRVAVLEDEGREICLYRFWRPAKQRWQYLAEPAYIVERLIPEPQPAA